jgi:predicted glycoside hydrolase/deacetylase ChbG (UPF0249 family)
VLVVNADDWGLRREVTDAIAECWKAEAITAASAMVGMADSGRAFELAAANGLPLGLHLNLTIALDGEVAPEVRSRQRRVVSYFGRARARRYLLDPFARGAVDRACADQLLAFAAAAGAPPRHLDGHQHIQTCPTVFASPALGAAASLREAHALTARGSRLRDAYRAVLNRAIRARFDSMPLFSMRDLHPALAGVGLGVLEDLATRGNVELMVHPAWEDERQILLSEDWRRWLAALPHGAHGEAVRGIGSRDISI